MTSRKDVYKYLAQSMIKNGLLGQDTGDVAQSSNGVMFIRIVDQVFMIEVQELKVIGDRDDAEEQGRLFMSTHPHPYTADDMAPPNPPGRPVRLH